MLLSPQGTSSTRCLRRCTAVTRRPTAARAARRCCSARPTTGTAAGRELACPPWARLCCSLPCMPLKQLLLFARKQIYSLPSQKQKETNPTKPEKKIKRKNQTKTKPPQLQTNKRTSKKLKKPKKATKKYPQKRHPPTPTKRKKRCRALRRGPRCVSEVSRPGSPLGAGRASRRGGRAALRQQVPERQKGCPHSLGPWGCPPARRVNEFGVCL